MRLRSLFSTAAAFFAASVPALGTAQTTGTVAVDREALRELRDILREEIKEELKIELKAELAADAAAAAPVREDAWAEEEWKWEEPVKPELNFLELDGYFRFRYELFYNQDLGSYYKNTVTGVESGPFAPGFPPPVPLCNTDVGMRPTPDNPAGSLSCANRAGEGNTLGGANMRLRLEPVLNVYEDIKIKAQLDVLDNLVLGSTPDGFPVNPITPLLVFSQTQIPPVDGINSLWTDSIRVKRVWAEVMTPLGQLRVGRMPSHFGMGILANEGRGLDQNFGDTADRIMFATKIGDFYVIPAYDWVVSGPTSALRFEPYGQPWDRDQRDDVDQYILAVMRRDKDEDIKRKLENDELVLNYGTYQIGRFQAMDAASYYNAGDPNRQGTARELIERDAQIYAYSYWFKLLWRKLSIEGEYAGIIGRVGNIAVAGPYGAVDGTHPDGIRVNQHGGVLNVEYRLLRDALTLRLMVLAASGDSAPGWGIRPLLSVANQPGVWDGTQAPPGDNRITNFRFDPDFVIDMIFWRQLVGMVTDAMVVRPGVQYNLTEGFGARLDFIYSRAWFANSTPSGSFTRLLTEEGGERDPLGRPSTNLGLEANAKVFFDSRDGFHIWLQYGIFFPFAGLDREVQVEPNSPLGTTVNNMGEPIARFDASVAHALRLLMAVSF